MPAWLLRRAIGSWGDGENRVYLGNVLSMFQPVGHDAQGESFHFSDGFGLRGPIGHYPRQVWSFRYPSPVVFLFYLYLQAGLSLSPRMLEILPRFQTIRPPPSFNKSGLSISIPPVSCSPTSGEKNCHPTLRETPHPALSQQTGRGKYGMPGRSWLPALDTG